MLELEEALSRILEAVPAPTSQSVALTEAHRRFTAERVLAPIELPTFDNSAMDGYALRAEDTRGASPETPAWLRIVGRVAAGATFTGKVGTRECVRLFTGSLLPDGADAVVMQEDTRPNAAEPERLAVLAAVEPGEYVRRRGQDVARGALLVEAGVALTASRLSLLAAAGLERIAVGRRPVVGVLATGSELREPGQPLAPGQIYESNRIGLGALIHNAGAEAKTFPIVKDALEATRAALLEALEGCDILVTSGGVSVGELDFVKRAFEETGGELSFWKVAVKPGRPFLFGRRQQKLLFGLPGNPVSAHVTFLLLVRPALLGWQGAREVSLPCSVGHLAGPIENQGGRRHFVRVRMDADGTVHSAGLQVSHALGSLAAANGLVDVPPETTLENGAPVRVLHWE